MIHDFDHRKKVDWFGSSFRSPFSMLSKRPPDPRSWKMCHTAVYKLFWASRKSLEIGLLVFWHSYGKWSFLLICKWAMASIANCYITRGAESITEMLSVFPMKILQVTRKPREGWPGVLNKYIWLVGGIPTPLKKWLRQLGWWHSQLNGNIKHVPNHQPVTMGFQHPQVGI